jgi:hypothetical protein
LTAGSTTTDGLRFEVCFSQSLNSSDSLVLQHAHHYPPILRLSFRGLIVADLPILTHRSWSLHSGERNVTLLKQDNRHVAARSSLSFWFRVTLPTGEA